jgi:hypothetical protein
MPEDLRVFGPLTLPVHRREAMVPRLLEAHEAAITSLVHDGTDRRFPGTILHRWRPHDRRMCSVLSRQAWRADALTKVAALAPDSQRPALLNRLGGRLLEQVPNPDILEATPVLLADAPARFRHMPHTQDTLASGLRGFWPVLDGISGMPVLPIE